MSLIEVMVHYHKLCLGEHPHVGDASRDNDEDGHKRTDDEEVKVPRAPVGALGDSNTARATRKNHQVSVLHFGDELAPIIQRMQRVAPSNLRAQGAKEAGVLLVCHQVQHDKGRQNEAHDEEHWAELANSGASRDIRLSTVTR